MAWRRGAAGLKELHAAGAVSAEQINAECATLMNVV